jgi:hypothetical protein
MQATFLLLQSLYKSSTGLEPGTTIPWFDSFLSTNSMYTSYEVSGSMSFTGTGTCYGEVASATDLLPGTNDFTVEWFQKQSLGSDFPRIFSLAHGHPVLVPAQKVVLFISGTTVSTYLEVFRPGRTSGSTWLSAATKTT